MLLSSHDRTLRALCCRRAMHTLFKGFKPQEGGNDDFVPLERTDLNCQTHVQITESALLLMLCLRVPLW